MNKCQAPLCDNDYAMRIHDCRTDVEVTLCYDHFVDLALPPGFEWLKQVPQHRQRFESSL